MPKCMLVFEYDSLPLHVIENVKDAYRGERLFCNGDYIEWFVDSTDLWFISQGAISESKILIHWDW